MRDRGGNGLEYSDLCFNMYSIASYVLWHVDTRRLNTEHLRRPLCAQDEIESLEGAAAAEVCLDVYKFS